MESVQINKDTSGTKSPGVVNVETFNARDQAALY